MTAMVLHHFIRQLWRVTRNRMVATFLFAFIRYRPSPTTWHSLPNHYIAVWCLVSSDGSFVHWYVIIIVFNYVNWLHTGRWTCIGAIFSVGHTGTTFYLQCAIFLRKNEQIIGLLINLRGITRALVHKDVLRRNNNVINTNPNPKIEK